jgi:hypothetical protein
MSPEEIERYARHIVLREVGGPGQQKLRRARVLLVGAGGLGSPLALSGKEVAVAEALSPRERGEFAKALQQAIRDARLERG